MKLSPRLEAFCIHFIENGGKAYDASIKAGFSDKVALTSPSSILGREDVRSRLGELSAPIVEGGVSIKTVLDDIGVIKELARVPYYDAQGNKRHELGALLKAAELEGKYLKMFSDKIDIELKNKVINTVNLEGVPTEVLEKIEAIYNDHRERKDAIAVDYTVSQ